MERPLPIDGVVYQEQRVITRIWRGWVSTDRADEYVQYMAGTGLAEYVDTPGNQGAQMVTRDLGDGRTEVLTLSWWGSMDAVRAFAGNDVDAAKYHPEDDDYLIDREDTVLHYVVANGAVVPPAP